MKSNFTKYGKDWSSIADKSFSWKFIEKPTLNAYLKPLLKKTSKLLDAGCGPGRYFSYYRQNGILEKDIIGLDPNVVFLAEARQKFPKIKYHEALLSQPQKFKQQDLIVASYVLHLLDDKDLMKALKNFHTWLKKGGHIFFIGNHPVRLVRDDLSTYNQRRWQNFPTPWGQIIRQYHRTTADYLDAFIDAGFQLECVAEPAPLPRVAKIDKKQYKNYTSTPCRLLVIAKKL